MTGWLRANAAQHTKVCRILRWIILLIFFWATITIVIVHECPAGEESEKPLLCAPVPGGVPGYLLAQTLHGQAALKTEEGYEGKARWSDSINQGDSGRCCSNWLPTSWTQYIIHLGWGWHFNGSISLGRILLLCVFDYIMYCVKLLHWDELILPSSIQCSLCCLSRILPVSWWNPLK